jgi:hypothetical protein
VGGEIPDVTIIVGIHKLVVGRRRAPNRGRPSSTT